MNTDTDLLAPHLLHEELSRAQQSGRLGEAHRENVRVNRAQALGYQLRLAMVRLIC